MKRFFVTSIEDPPVLRGEEHKHLSVVLRAKPGDEVTLCTGDGFDYLCRIESIGRNETRLSLCGKEKNACDPLIRCTLYMSLMKGDKNDWVVQKATELGVSEIVPVITRYVQGHDRVCKIDRLQRIAVEAAKQCGRSMPPAVRPAVPFMQILPELSAFDVTVFPYEKAESPSLRAFLRQWENTSVHSAAVLIGSEGGFADEEAAALTQIGITPVTLGKRILRAETANIAVLSIVAYALEQSV